MSPKLKKGTKRNQPSVSSTTALTVTTSTSTSTAEPSNDGTYEIKYLRDNSWRIHKVKIRYNPVFGFDSYCTECFDKGYWFCVATSKDQTDPTTKEQYDVQTRDDRIALREAYEPYEEGKPPQKKKKPAYPPVEEVKEQITKWCRSAQSILHLAYDEYKARGKNDIMINGWNHPDLVLSGLATGITRHEIGLTVVSVEPPQPHAMISAGKKCVIKGCPCYPNSNLLRIHLRTSELNGTLSDSFYAIRIRDWGFPEEEGEWVNYTQSFEYIGKGFTRAVYICDYHAEMVSEINRRFIESHPPLESLVEKERNQGAIVVMNLLTQRDHSCITSGGVIFNLPNVLISIIASYLS